MEPFDVQRDIEYLIESLTVLYALLKNKCRSISIYLANTNSLISLKKILDSHRYLWF